ncbi:DUF72 domain-containing protein [Pedosphaera parvula]|uniref:DUF72 domain-containing protein n=1 Tax=Pedosphaera parvula (strain Ellin514) TaxID=320771 RepID=B9XIT3_PEDPL|nr:DUF72 domain-containing protein [Pedosphaera parvula]EEF60160.1 protein of unknown function DUF72 [Pedosphaera parvula Ellin514]
MNANILVGTASWSDPGFIADWYPHSVSAADRLRWYAEHFNLVEVNSTFYHIPAARVVERWCEQTPEGFVFDVKLHRLLSRHSTKPEFLPARLRPSGAAKDKKVPLTPALEKAVLKSFLSGIRPLEDAGKVGALLLQLSPSFSPKKNNLTELDTIYEALEGRTLAVELRNRDWVTGKQLEDTEKYFAEREITFVNVDGPKDTHFMVMPGIDLVTNPKLSYLRAHGRNAKGFVRGRDVATRFNHDYKKPELKQIAERSIRLADQARQVHVVCNNNFSNYAPKAAAALQKMFQERGVEVGDADKAFAF